MSNYFGALMRSSGLSVGADATSVALPTQPVPAHYGIEEIVEERIVEQSPALSHPATPAIIVPALETHVAPIADAVSANWPIGDHTLIGEEESNHAARIETAPPPSAEDKAKPAATTAMFKTHAAPLPDTVTANIPTDGHTLIGEEKSSHTLGKTTLPAKSALVRAALRRVGAGENHATEELTTPAPQSGSPDVSEAILARVRVEPLVDEPSAILRDPFLHPQTTIPDHPREDVIEVSIGSIHVRVDAPPSSAVASAAPSPVTRPAAETPPRSGFSRRTLWRI